MRRGSLKFLPILATLAVGVSSAQTPKNKTLQVTVLDEVPTTINYDWSVSGSSGVSCYGDSCSGYYNPASSGTAQAGGAIVRLQLQDGRIVIAECEMKPNQGANWAMAIAGGMNGQYASTIYRDCRTPESGAVINAKFKGDKVKLFMHYPSIDGKGKGYSETYRINGVLEPKSGEADGGSSKSPTSYSTKPTVPSSEEQLGVQEYLHQQYKDALPHFMAAAQEGNADAYSYLGYMYELGRGVAVDDGVSAKWFRKSVAAGKLSDQTNLTGETVKAKEQPHNSLCFVATTPAGAKIYVDGLKGGVSPFAFVLMSHGNTPRRVTVKLSGYKTVEQKFVPDGKTIPIVLTLQKTP